MIYKAFEKFQRQGGKLLSPYLFLKMGRSLHVLIVMALLNFGLIAQSQNLCSDQVRKIANLRQANQIEIEKEKKRQKLEWGPAFDNFIKTIDRTIDPQIVTKFGPSALWEIFEFYHFKGIELVALKLFNYRWFLDLEPVQKRYFLITVMRLYYLSGRIKDQKHATALRNTADFIANGYYRFVAGNGYRDIGGSASPKEIFITNEVLARNRTLGRMTDIDSDLLQLKKDGVIFILAHEISHIISGTPVGKNFNYFVEEYRARQVTFFVTNGQLPDARVSLRFALELLLGSTSLYPDIQQSISLFASDYQNFLVSFYKDPEIAAKHLETIQSAQNLEYPARMQLVENLLSQMHVEAQAPLIGWNDFLLNAPKSSDQKLMQSEIVNKELIEKINRLKESLFPDPREASRW